MTFVFLSNRQERTGKTVLSAEDHMDDGSRIKLTISIDEKEVDSLHMRVGILVQYKIFNGIHNQINCPSILGQNFEILRSFNKVLSLPRLNGLL